MSSNTPLRRPTNAIRSSAAGRLWDGVRRHGARDSARLLGERARQAIYLREAHLWYALELDRRLDLVLAQGLSLVPAGPDEVELLDSLPTVPTHEARKRRAVGAELWLVLDDGALAFACWIFPGRTPVLAARGGWLALPDGVVCLEDSVTAATHRGRGIAPAAWSAVADAQAARGHRTMITKVSEDNASSRRAVEKAGFRKVATMRVARTGSRARVEVEVQGGEPVAQELAARLER